MHGEAPPAPEDAARLRRWHESLRHDPEVGVFERNLDTGEGYWDDNTNAAWGQPPGSPPLSQAALREALLPADRSLLDAELLRASQPGQAGHVVFRMVNAQGQQRSLRCTWLVSRLTDGTRVATGTMHDITSLVQTDARWRQRERLLSEAAETAGVGLVSRHIASGNLHMNRAARRMMGLPEEGPLLVPMFVQRLHPDDQAAIETNWQRMLASEGQVLDIQLRVPLPDGQMKHLLARRSLIRDEQGQPQQVAGVLMDVTQQVAAQLRETRLRTSRSLALEVAGIGGWELRGDSELLEMDTALLAIFGWTGRPPLVRTAEWLAAIHPRDQGRVGRSWRALMDGQLDRGSADFRIVRPSGEVRWLRTNFARLRHADGRSAGVYGMCLDQTEEQLLQRKLNEERAVMAVAERLALVGSFRRRLDGSQPIWSAQTYRIFGIDPVAGPPGAHQRHFFGTQSSWSRLLVAEAQQLRDEKPFELELEVRRADGTPLWVRIWAELEHDDTGRAVARVGCIQDISAVVAMRQQADAADQRLRAVFNGSMLGILLVDDCARFVDVNPAMSRLLGYSRQELLAMTALQLGASPEDRSPQEAWAQVLQRGQLSGRIRLGHRNGHAVPVEFSAVAHIQPGVHLCVLADVSAQVQAETHLRQAQQRLRELAARQQEDFDALRAELARDVHDQLGQTLSALKLELGLLRTQAPDAAQRMHALVQSGVDTVRDVSRLLRPAALDLGAVPALRTLAAEASMHGDLDVVLHLPDEGVSLPEPAVRALYRIAQEALSNAARHADAQALLLRLTPQPGAVCLEVQDDGCGFDTAAPRGAGLGMLGMLERARQLGADLAIHSQPGQGTRVVLTLPIPAQEAPA